MKYLGVNYIYDDVFKIYISGKGNYLDLESMKKGIRKLVLPTYQPTKTLAWLEEMTGRKFRYLHNHKQLISVGYNDIYDFNDNTACIYNNKICILSESANGEWVDMTPREFIEKIAKGEWI